MLSKFQNKFTKSFLKLLIDVLIHDGSIKEVIDR